MTIAIDDLFKHSYVISIDDARLSQFKQIFSLNKLPESQFFLGFEFKTSIVKMRKVNVPNVLNCAYSHAALIKYAQMMDWPYVCIFEDDAYPCYDIKTKLEFYLKDIPDDCECLLLGNIGDIHATTLVDDKFLKLVKFGYGYGSHAYVIFKSAYAKILSLYNSCAIADYVFLDMNCYVPKFNLFIQYCKEQSMNGHSGYFWKHRTLEQIFKEFPRIEEILKDNLNDNHN